MLNWFSKTAALAGLLAVGLTACKKDEVRVTSEFSTPPVLTASATSAVLAQGNADKPALTYSWTPYTITLSDGSKAVSPVTYTLQFAKAGTAFKSVQEISAGVGDDKSLTISTATLNTALQGLKLPFTETSQVDVRLKTTVAGNIAPLYSATTMLMAKPYNFCAQPAQSWALVGPAGNGWPNATDITDIVMPYDCDKGAYVLRTALNVGDFKFRADKAWDTNLGGLAKGITPGATSTELKPGGEDFTNKTAGTYLVKLEIVRDATGKVTGGVVTVAP